MIHWWAPWDSGQNMVLRLLLLSNLKQSTSYWNLSCLCKATFQKMWWKSPPPKKKSAREKIYFWLFIKIWEQSGHQTEKAIHLNLALILSEYQRQVPRSRKCIFASFSPFCKSCKIWLELQIVLDRVWNPLHGGSWGAENDRAPDSAEWNPMFCIFVFLYFVNFENDRSSDSAEWNPTERDREMSKYVAVAVAM